MKFWLKWIRWIILSGSILLALILYIWIRSEYQIMSLLSLRLASIYAFLALGFLYLALLCTPLYTVFPKIPGKVIYIRARRAIGVSAFLFAALHASFNFFGTLGGFEGLSFLAGRHLTAVILGITVLFILTLMAITSIDFAVKKMARWWKVLHRFVYLAGVLIIFHAAILGSHFADFRDPVAVFWFVLLIILLLLQSIRLDKYIKQKYPESSRFSLVFVIAVALLSVLVYYYFFHTTSFGGHVHGS
jgi:methionine sulfoxide reductase heme-binding subunit